MHDAVQELRIRAELLHHLVKRNDARALQRFGRSAVLSPGEIRRRDCLTLLATELGFENWPHAKRVLSGEAVADYGTLLYPKRCDGHLNLWFRTHAEAISVRQGRQGYLLTYRRDFVVVDRSFIESLRLEPDDPDWQILHFDWARDDRSCIGARARLYAKLVAMLPPEAQS
jgi:hypothetical protein